MNKINLLIHDYFVSSRTEDYTSFFYPITYIFDFSLLFLIISGIIFYIIYRIKGLFFSIYFFSSIFFTLGAVFILKLIFNTERPDGPIIDVMGASFPSYHATISTVFFLTLIHIFKDNIKSFNTVVFHVVAFLMIFLVSISRVYLGVHWFSDVFFGVILGVIIHHISIHIFKKYK